MTRLLVFAGTFMIICLLFTLKIETGFICSWGSYVQYCAADYMNRDTLEGDALDVPWILIRTDQVEPLIDDSASLAKFRSGGCIPVRSVYLDFFQTSNLNGRTFREVLFLYSSALPPARACGATPALPRVSPNTACTPHTASGVR